MSFADHLCIAGPRTAKGIADAVTAELTEKNIARPTTSAAMEEFLSASTLPKASCFHQVVMFN